MCHHMLPYILPKNFIFVNYIVRQKECFYRQKTLVGLRRVQATFIMRKIIIVGKAFSRLGVVLIFSPIFSFDLLHTISEGCKT